MTRFSSFDTLLFLDEFKKNNSLIQPRPAYYGYLVPKPETEILLPESFISVESINNYLKLYSSSSFGFLMLRRDSESNAVFITLASYIGDKTEAIVTALAQGSNYIYDNRAKETIHIFSFISHEH